LGLLQIAESMGVTGANAARAAKNAISLDTGGYTTIPGRLYFNASIDHCALWMMNTPLFACRPNV